LGWQTSKDGGCFQAALLAEPALVLPLPRRAAVTRPGAASAAQVLCITVPVGLPHVYSLEGRYLGREGAQTNPLPARRLRQLLVERGAVQFEARPLPDVTLDDLDPLQVQAYVERANQDGLLPPSVSAQDWLVRRGCLWRVEGALRPTYAALLLFGRCPQQWLPNATLLAGRFPGMALSDSYIKQDINGTLPEQLRQAEAFVRSNLRSVVRLVGLEHQESPEYPFEAVRELLVNAIAHRDYNIQGDNVHLYIFADRLEVHSPGSLPGPVTLENLLEARFSRNPVIMQVLSDLGFVERLGYGLNRVIAVTRAAGLRPPRFEETSGSFRVTLYSRLGGATEAELDLTVYAGLELNPRQQMALAYLARNRRITSREYQELCPDVHAETLRRDLAELVSQGVLLKIGDKRATYYILKKVPAAP
jgi:ATP-dependent DNA helicase RecG